MIVLHIALLGNVSDVNKPNTVVPSLGHLEHAYEHTTVASQIILMEIRRATLAKSN